MTSEFASATSPTACLAVVACVRQLSLSDFGLFKRDVVGGAAVGLAVYCSLQILLMATSVVAGEGIEPSPALMQPVGLALGMMIGQLFGTGLVEESVFRGFLFRQCLMRTRATRPVWSYATAAAIAAVPFALWHIPQRVSNGIHGSELAFSLTVLWVEGIIAAYLYVRSQNLMVVVALHALVNNPAPLLAAPVHPKLALGCIMLALVLLLEVRARRKT